MTFSPIHYLLLTIIGLVTAVGGMYSGIVPLPWQTMMQDGRGEHETQSRVYYPPNQEQQAPLTILETPLPRNPELTYVPVTWHEHAKPLTDVSLGTATYSPQLPLRYNEVGVTRENERVLTVQVPCEAFCDYSDPYFIIERADGGYEFLLRNRITMNENEATLTTLGEHPFSADWSDKVIFDSSKVLEGLLVPTFTLSKEGVNNAVAKTTLAPREDVTMLAATTTPREFIPVPAVPNMVRGRIMRPALQGYPSAYLEQLYMKLPADMYVAYDAQYDFYPEFNGIPNIVWKDGRTNQAAYRADGAGGCGGMGALAIDTAGTTAVPFILEDGRTVSGEPIYLALQQHPLAALFYKASGGKKYIWDEKAQTNKEFPFTLHDFEQAHGVILYNDMLGRTLILSNMEYGPQTECGKPVIYLYPQTPTDVHVEVGADITKSEPTYAVKSVAGSAKLLSEKSSGRFAQPDIFFKNFADPASISGWYVHAQPYGDLTLLNSSDARVYPYLYWEGLGHGLYPEIAQGVIVSTVDAEKILRTHLAQLGLRGREVTDFLDFWLPRMPQTPYVRLSWLGTKEMDELAPLTITPKPDTVIRVFLDFAGVETPYPIEPQRLSSATRTGFTVVEWGGLLRN